MKPVRACLPALPATAAALLCLAAAVAPGTSAAADAPPAPVTITIDSRKSLVHMGSVDSTALTPDGIQAAKLLLDSLQGGNPKFAEAAYEIYKKIIPLENFGGDYTALQWLIDVYLAPPERRETLITNPFERSYWDFWANGDYAQLKEYLQRKYKLGEFKDQDPGEGVNRRQFLEDFILFNNPRREEWEKSSEMVASLGLKPGQRVVDIGSGPGYFTFKFAALVGDQGRVFAEDIVSEHLDYVKTFSARNNINNVQAVLGGDNDIGLKDEKVDVAWMCSLYHIIYVAFNEKDKDAFIGSIMKALKDDGTFYVVDNGLVPEGVLPYHAPYIDKSLIIGQLQAYGFRLVKEYQFIPQRYILAFKKK